VPVLIHGLWMTARSWDRWVEYYRAKGHEVIVPTYPGFEIDTADSPATAPTYFPIVNASTTDFAHPFVMTIDGNPAHD
jgi:hypothetical protein